MSNDTQKPGHETGQDDARFQYWDKMKDLMHILDGMPREHKRQLLEAASGTIGFKLVARGVNVTGIPTVITENIVPPRGGNRPVPNGNQPAKPKGPANRSPYGDDPQLLSLKNEEKGLVERLKKATSAEDQFLVRNLLEATRVKTRDRKAQLNPAFRSSSTRNASSTSDQTSGQ